MMTLLGVRLPNGVSPGRTIGMFEKDLDPLEFVRRQIENVPGDSQRTAPASVGN